VTVHTDHLYIVVGLSCTIHSQNHHLGQTDIYIINIFMYILYLYIVYTNTIYAFCTGCEMCTVYCMIVCFTEEVGSVVTGPAS